MNNNHYSDEQVEWLKQNFSLASSYKQLAELFNRKFHSSRTPAQLSDKCGKNLKLTGMPNSSKYGRKAKEELPIGTIRKTAVGTYIKVKLCKSGAHMSGYRKPFWRPLQRKIYQDKYGEIGDNDMICFLDGNQENYDIDNLYCINRQISQMMSTNNWWTKSREHTLTAIKLCELQLSLANKTIPCCRANVDDNARKY